MRGVEPSQPWTHFLVGFIVAGTGAGLINVPLASTAVGVVHPHRAGMASGINSTFRQIGIATGVAALGTIFTTQVRDSITEALSSTPIGSHAAGFADAVASGRIGPALSSLPGQDRASAVAAASTAFADALNDILLIGAIASFAAAALTFVLIRRRDFHPGEEVDDAAEQAAHAAA
jgi:hypothetical protein